MSFYLFRSDGNIKTLSSKSDLLTEIRVITTLKSVPLKENSAVIIDFMAHARKVTGEKNKLQIRTFGDWVELLWTCFLSLNEATKRIDIVFDLILWASFLSLNEATKRIDIVFDLILRQVEKMASEKVELQHMEPKRIYVTKINR